MKCLESLRINKKGSGVQIVTKFVQNLTGNEEDSRKKFDFFKKKDP